jgi:hypothetical protein
MQASRKRNLVRRTEREKNLSSALSNVVCHLCHAGGKERLKCCSIRQQYHSFTTRAAERAKSSRRMRVLTFKVSLNARI